MALINRIKKFPVLLSPRLNPPLFKKDKKNVAVTSEALLFRPTGKA